MEMTLVVLILLLINLSFSLSFMSLSQTNIRYRNIKLADNNNNNNNDLCGPCPMAPKCNGEYKDKGCDGTGKIQGGIATIGFMSWWPIKVYRPCPSYLKAGYQYRREGQTMDQVLFSEPSTKQKEKFEALKREEAEKALGATKSSSSEVKEKIEIELTDAEKLLQERFGSKNDQ